MFEVRGPRSGMSRRAMLRVGALAPLGLALPQFLGASDRSSAGKGASFGKAKRCLMIFMWGGPSHIDLWDMKPDAPSEVRGEFSPMRTRVPGIQICEHLPHLAKHTDKLGFIRSVTHSDNNHSTSAHWMLTGHQHPLKRENFGARRTDYPQIGSVLSKFAPNEGSIPTFVALPELIGTTAGFITPGQNGGFLGLKHDPFRIDQHPDAQDFAVPNLRPVEGVTRGRMESRLKLLEQFDGFRGEWARGLEGVDLNSVQQKAVDMVSAPEVYKAFDLSAEGLAERNRYGMQTFGQSVLLARRLLESGVKLVTVYWHRDKPGVDTTWDTHKNNFGGLKDRLIPQVDRPLAMLLEDMKSRGMLDDTLIVWNSEFGRTPKVNKNAGRDHWGRCNTIWMAGAGVPGGQQYGASDKTASEPTSDPVSPQDVSATIYHLLGLDPNLHIHDRLQRPFPISFGKPLERFLA